LEEQKLEKILNSAFKAEYADRLICHLSYHKSVAEKLVEYGLKKLENGSYANTKLFDAIFKISKLSHFEQYKERIAIAYSNLPSTWAVN